MNEDQHGRAARWCHIDWLSLILGNSDILLIGFLEATLLDLSAMKVVFAYLAVICMDGVDSTYA